jgi:hypothetical protein
LSVNGIKTLTLIIGHHLKQLLQEESLQPEYERCR